jgi:hypothetical protein
MNNKQAYFQGGGGINEPTPKQQKYDIEESVVAQPRFDKPFYRNYDLYEVEGFKEGPGTGAYKEYKSVKDFLQKSRKKNKYKAKDTWNKKKSKRKARAKIIYNIVKKAFDFTVDTQYNTPAILGDMGAYIDSTGIGGNLDEYLTLNDFEGKNPSQLNLGRDYQEDDKNFIYLINKILNPKEPDLLGLSNGFEPEEELDPHNTIYRINPDYVTTDSGNTIYDNTWF